MDMEIFDMVNVALGRAIAGDAKGAELVLTDIRDLMTERLDVRGETVEEPAEREKNMLDHIFGDVMSAPIFDFSNYKTSERN